MTKRPHLLNRYSISFKQKIVGEIETEGKSISEIRRIYGIKGAATVQNWLKT
jgi:transposase